MAKKISIVRFYPHTIDKVWFALTNKHALATWFTENDLPGNLDEMPIGFKFSFVSKPQGSWDGRMHCELLQVSKQELLVYSFAGNWMKQPTTVTWKLRAEDGGTTLTLEHTGFEGLRGYLLSFILKAGWKKSLSSNKFITALG
jgi:uncharacterized protein YndB with AHSA1/START domain